MFTTILRVATASGALLLLAACGSADPPRKPPPPVEETVFRDLAVTPIQKAKNVENVVMEQKRQTDKALEQNDQ